ncbi:MULTISPECIES: glycosyltransferase [unclassified Rhizobium]
MSETASFTINGRFLVQKATGVQRYATNVVKALDELLATSAKRVQIVSPRGARDLGLANLSLIEAGPLAGHSWEQIILPARCQGRLLNLCNTAPLLKTDQILCIHDANVFASPESYGRTFRAAYQTLQPVLAQRSARVTAVSHAAARQIARHLPVSLKDIAVIPNGHEHALKWDPAKAQIAPDFIQVLEATTGRPFVLVLGSRARHKNLSLLVNAAPDLDAIGINLVVAGGGDGIYAADILQSRPNVKFIGRVTDDDLAYLLDNALCLAFPSFTEGFGLPIIEAMARGCPVVASDCASMPEVCGDAALMASPNDAKAWVDSIRALVLSPELRTDLVGRGHEQAQRFRWCDAAAVYLDLLERPSSQAQSYNPPQPRLPRTAVVVATRGRPEVVKATVQYLLGTQTFAPEALIVSCVNLADAGDLVDNPAVTVLTGPPGLAAQRNTALGALPPTAEIVAFFDDDFIADKEWLRKAAATFRDESQVIGFTGRVLKDGITGDAVSFDEGLRLIDSAPPCDWTWIEPYSPYGCNMAFRVSAIGDTRFDERLVLYGWLEDRDFAAAIAKPGGRLVKGADAFGVHMGVKSGRVAGDRLGYSQIANPIYLLLKGTMSSKRVFTHIGANMLSNFVKALKPEPFIDRRGRAKGNLIAIADVVCGKITPEKAAMLSSASQTLKVNVGAKSR